MVITLELDAASRALVARHAAAAPQADAAFAAAMGTAVFAGAEGVREDLVTGQLGLNMQHPASGLAASVMGWMISEDPLLGAVGVPSNTPAARYARMQEEGGRIVPKTAKALAIPISEEAKGHTSPTDMEGLTLMPRKGKPPLLVREFIAGGAKFQYELGRPARKTKAVRKSRVEVHWVLVPSVTITGTGWLTNGVRRAVGATERAFGGRLREFVRRWKGN